MRRIILAAAFGLFALAPLTASAELTDVDVDIVAPDGFTLRATYWEAAAPGPGVLLLHQCNRERGSWDALARELAGAGLHVLALDFRGFGEGEGAASFREQGEALWPLYEGDVDRAMDFLISLPHVDSARIGAVGASCGGSQALLLSSRNESVRALVFLSSSLPWIGSEDIAVFERTRDVPLLGIAADGDEQALDRTRQLFANSRHDKSRLVLYKSDLHGVPLFEHDPALPGTIVDFLVRTLRTAD
ncbi:MAG: dienelactone hydrolase family protein [Candidatus Eiseniibacteriota bacterium]